MSRLSPAFVLLRGPSAAWEGPMSSRTDSMSAWENPKSGELSVVSDSPLSTVEGLVCQVYRLRGYTIDLKKRLSIWDEPLSTKEGILTVWMGTCWPEIPLQYDYSILNNSETVARNAAVLFLSSSTCTDSSHPLSKFKGERSEFVTYIDFCVFTIRRFRSKTAKRLDIRQKISSRADCK